MASNTTSGGNPADDAARSLAALGASLLPDAEAVNALLSAQSVAETLSQSVGLRLSSDTALSSALAATRSIRVNLELPQPTIRIAEQLQRSLATMHNIALPLQQMRVDLSSLQFRWAEFLRSWQGVQDSIAASVARMARAVDWDAVVRGVIDVEAVAARRELIAAFRTARLLPAHSMPAELLEYVRETYRKGGGSSPISNIVSGRYARADWDLLSRIREGWHEVPYLDSRTELLRQAEVAMRGKLFLLVAPALVPQIEGISADFLRGATGSGRFTHRQLSTTLADHVPAQAAVHVGTAAVEGFLKFLDDELFAYVDFDKRGTRETGRLNRHVLLHGRDMRQATRMNGVRAFILLDVLGAVVRQVERQSR